MHVALLSISLHSPDITFALKGEFFCNTEQELGTFLSYLWQKQLYAPGQLRSPIMYPAMPYQPWEPLIHQIYSSYLCNQRLGTMHNT